VARRGSALLMQGLQEDPHHEQTNQPEEYRQAEGICSLPVCVPVCVCVCVMCVRTCV
jgi:hypothetical protein